MATKEVAIYENKIEDHKTINSSVVSYEIYVPPKNKKKKKKKLLRSGLRQVEENYNEDVSYSAYPGMVSIHDNKFKNKHFIPALDNDFGLLWVMKNKLQIPDVAYDAILPSNYFLDNSIPNPDYKICVKNNGKINFVAMDAANVFEKFSNDLDDYACDVEFEL